MPLRDHFHSPVNDKHHWSSFHAQWPAEIVRTLFDRLPPGFQAGPRVYLGSSFEIDISVAEDENRIESPLVGEGDPGGTATLSAVREPYTVGVESFPLDEYEVRVYDNDRGLTLVAAIEIVSPSNKDRDEAREQFVGKVGALLREGVCVSIVDIVTNRSANLYADWLARSRHVDPQLGSVPPAISAVTLHPRGRRKLPAVVDAWYFPLEIGQPLPTIPIWLSPELQITLPLEPSYQETCRLLRIA